MNGARMEPAHPPAVFTHIVATPPGMPWDQARVASLEAVRAAPVAIETLTVRLKRLTAWRQGKPAEYAAFYVKTESLAGGFRTAKSVNGRTINLDFKPKEQAAAEAKVLAILAGSAGLAVVAVLIATIAAAAIRHGGAAKLDDLTRKSARQLQQARMVSELKRQNASLAAVAEPGAPVAQVMADLAWASQMHKSDVPVEAFHWRTAGFGVEVRGAESPFNSPDAQRIARQLRPGVWLWVKPRPANGARQNTGRRP